MEEELGRFNYEENVVTEAVKKNLISNYILLAQVPRGRQVLELKYPDGWYKGEVDIVEDKQIR